MESDAAARRSHFLSVYDAQEVTDAQFTQLASDVAAAIRDTCGEKMTIECYPLAMNRVERALNRIYPETRGAPSRIESGITALTNRSARRSIKAALSPIMKRMQKVDPEFYGAIRDAHAGGDR